jgi:hypothetical protein
VIQGFNPKEHYAPSALPALTCESTHTQCTWRAEGSICTQLASSNQTKPLEIIRNQDVIRSVD